MTAITQDGATADDVHVVRGGGGRGARRGVGQDGRAAILSYTAGRQKHLALPGNKKRGFTGRSSGS